MCAFRERQTGVFGLCLMVALAAVYGPALQTAWEEDARRQSAQAAERTRPGYTQGADQTRPGHSEDAEQEDQQVILVPGCGEWDRQVKTSELNPWPKIVVRARVVTLRLAPLRQRLAVSPPVSASAILATNGPHRNHAPHAPPTAVS